MGELPTSSDETLKQYVLNFVKQEYFFSRSNAATLKAGEPHYNFQTVLGFGYERYDPARLQVSENRLSYRYQLALGDKLTIGLGTALMDGISGALMALVGKHPGASVFFQMQWFPENIIEGDDSIELVNVLTKHGRTIAHTRTTIFSADKKLIGHSTHVKYLPTAGFVVDKILIPYGAPWTSERLSRVLHWALPTPSAQALAKFGAHKSVNDNLRVLADGHGEFEMKSEHCNPMGTLHGGCSAMIMEKVAEPFAQALFENCKCHMESLQIQFLAAGRGEGLPFQIESEIIECVEKEYALIRVNILKVKSGKINLERKVTVLSQGLLKYVRSLTLHSKL